MKKTAAFLIMVFILIGCNSTDKSQKNDGISSKKSEPEKVTREKVIQALFYQNGDYKPVMVTLNESGQNARQEVSFLYFVKMELGKEGVYVTYIYNDLLDEQHKKIMKYLSKEQYINIMEPLLNAGILDMLAYTTEDSYENQIEQDANLLEISLELKVLRLYYTPADAAKLDFKKYKKLIDIIKDIDTFIR